MRGQALVCADQDSPEELYGFSPPRSDEARFLTSRAMRRNNRRAQTNSVASMARPIGIMIVAGPGSTIMAIPISSTDPPTTITISRQAVLKVYLITAAEAYFSNKLLIVWEYPGVISRTR